MLLAVLLQTDCRISALHVPGRCNLAADYLSREFALQRVNPLVFRWISTNFALDLDLFASQYNAVLPQFCSYAPEEGAFWLDAFANRADWA